MPISLSGSLNLSGSINTNGTITATTLVVQTITSSISSITGSTNFGSLSSDTHKFTGSLLISGSNVLIGTPTSNGFRFKVSNNGAEEIAINPGDSANLNNYVNYNRSTSTYIAANYLAATHSFLNGNVGIGTSSPVTKLDVSGTIRSIAQTDPTSGTGLELFYRSADPACYVQSYDRTNSAYVDLKLAASRILFYYANPSSVECARFSGLGYFKATNSGTYINTSGQYHEFSNSATNNEIFVLRNTSASPYGYTLQFSGASPNNSTNWIMYCEDSTAQRFSVRSNGGVYNYTGNNVPLSDQRMKKEITLLESYWDKFKSIEMVKFKYIDQTHDDFNIGVVSQQIESIMPEFVDVWDEKNIPEDGKPLMGVYMEDIHNIAMKVLQEAMTKIETLEARVQYLENK
jgi:hypothetical protein